MFSRRKAIAGIGATAGLIALPSCSRAAEPLVAPQNTKSAFESFSRLASALVEKGRTAGIAVGMSGVGFRKSAYFGFSDIASKTKVGPDTQFRIASITKPIVAAATLQMVEAGRLSLQAPLSQFFPDFPNANEITVADLLQHTSGLANWWGRMPANTPNDFMNRSDAVTWLARMKNPFLFAPGTMRSYSNSGFVVLGKVLEQVEKAPLGQILDFYVLDRVGAAKTGFERARRQKDIWATGYQAGWSGFSEAPLVPPPYAAGGLRSTLHDQLAFSDALFLGPLLEAETKQRMLAHAKVRDGRLVQDAMYVAPGAEPEPMPENTSELGYGLGINTWVQLGERFYSHGGLIDGFSSYLLHAPRTGISVSILANTFQVTAELNEHARSLLRALP
jgi:D-alanyl-D-alanine carboxypeptidase